MLWSIYVFLCALWLFAIFSGNMLGGFIHIVLALAILIMFFRVHQGAKVSM